MDTANEERDEQISGALRMLGLAAVALVASFAELGVHGTTQHAQLFTRELRVVEESEDRLGAIAIEHASGRRIRQRGETSYTASMVQF